MIKILFLILGVLMFNENVFASSYVPTTNLFEGTQTNNLFDMANNQIDNFTSKKFVMFQNDNNYYIVVSDNFTISGNAITLTDTTIISAIRTSSSGYNYYYEYSTTSEESTTINLDYVVISNIKASNTVSSSRFDNYKFNLDLRNIGIFILGICFALFITKERKF